MSYTKGKWEITNKADGFCSTENNIIISDELDGKGRRKVVARISSLFDGINNNELAKEMQSNGKLIAAAPDLLEALKDTIIDVTKRCTNLGIDCTKYSTWINANNAIKKATL